MENPPFPVFTTAVGSAKWFWLKYNPFSIEWKALLSRLVLIFQPDFISDQRNKF